MANWLRRLIPGLVAGLVVVSAVGCSSPTAPTGGGANPPADGPVTPKVPRVIMAVDPVGVESNALRLLSSPDVWIFRSVYEYPLALDIKTGKVGPGLATEWNVEPDGLSFRVKLRKGVQFHDNWGEMTAKDFAHMVKDVAAPEANHGQTAYWRAALTGVDIVNDYEVIYRLAKPDGQFTLSISETQGGTEIRSKAQFDKMGGPPTDLKTAEAGTGWYQFKSRATATSLNLERVPYKHWDGVTPDFPEFEFRFIKEPSTRLAGLLSGEIHIAALPQDLLGQGLKSGMKVAKSIHPGVRVFGQMHCCYFNDVKDASKGYRYPTSPLMDVRVRRALNKAINKDELNKAFFGGKGELMQVNAFLPSREGWTDEWAKRYPEQYGYDLEKAKSLLAEAGFNAANPLKTSMTMLPIPGVAGGPDIIEAIAGYWRAAGVNVELLTIDAAEYTQRNRAWAFSNVVRITGSGSNQWTGVSVFNGASFGTSGGGIHDPDLEANLLELTRTYDQPKRDELWRKAGDAMFDHHLNINLFWLPAEAMINPTVVADWTFPGMLTGTWTHLQHIKAAR